MIIFKKIDIINLIIINTKTNKKQVTATAET